MFRNPGSMPITRIICSKPSSLLLFRRSSTKREHCLRFSAYHEKAIFPQPPAPHPPKTSKLQHFLNKISHKRDPPPAFKNAAHAPRCRHAENAYQLRGHTPCGMFSFCLSGRHNDTEFGNTAKKDKEK